MSIKLMTDKKFEMFLTSGSLRMAFGVKCSLSYINLLCTSSDHYPTACILPSNNVRSLFAVFIFHVLVPLR